MARINSGGPLDLPEETTATRERYGVYPAAAQEPSNGADIPEEEREDLATSLVRQWVI